MLLSFTLSEMVVQKLLTWEAQKQICSMRERNMVSKRGKSSAYRLCGILYRASSASMPKHIYCEIHENKVK